MRLLLDQSRLRAAHRRRGPRLAVQIQLRCQHGAQPGDAGSRSHQIQPLDLQNVTEALRLYAQRVRLFVQRHIRILHATQLDGQLVHVLGLLVLVVLPVLPASALPALEEPRSTSRPAPTAGQFLREKKREIDSESFGRVSRVPIMLRAHFAGGYPTFWYEQCCGCPRNR